MEGAGALLDLEADAAGLGLLPVLDVGSRLDLRRPASRVEAAKAAGCTTVEQITTWVARRGGSLAKTETERVLKAQQRTPPLSRPARDDGDDRHWPPRQPEPKPAPEPEYDF